jgi:hypothetical protein
MYVCTLLTYVSELFFSLLTDITFPVMFLTSLTSVRGWGPEECKI